MAFDLKEKLGGFTKLFNSINKKSSKLDKKKKTYLVAGGALVALVIFLVVMGVGIYKYKWDNKFTLYVTKVVPFPAATVNSGFVRYAEYVEQLDIMKKYQTEFKKVDFKSEEGKKVLATIRKDTLDRLIEDQLVNKEAKVLKVTLTTKELDESYADLIKSNGGEKSFAEVLRKYYDLSSEDFKQEIYKPRLLRQKVSDEFSKNDTVNQDSKAKAEEVLKKLTDGGDFATLAKQYSQDSTAANGGDLGLFGKGKMVPEFEQAAFALKAGETSGLVKTVYGYHIIKVTEVKGEEIRASHILIKTKDFTAWLEDAKASAKISDYIKVR